MNTQEPSRQPSPDPAERDAFFPVALLCCHSSHRPRATFPVPTTRMPRWPLERC